MDFDIDDLFGNLFGGTVPTMIVEATAQPEAVVLPTPTVEPEAADAEKVPDFDSLPLPGDPCPLCGSLETWWDILGGEHCQQCDRATLDKAIQWADRAARLRKQAERRKPAPRIAPDCVAGGSVDTLDLGSGTPLQAMPEGLIAV